MHLVLKHVLQFTPYLYFEFVVFVIVYTCFPLQNQRNFYTRQIQDIFTASNSAACGSYFEIGSEYLILGKVDQIYFSKKEKTERQNERKKKYSLILKHSFYSNSLKQIKFMFKLRNLVKAC